MAESITYGGGVLQPVPLKSTRMWTNDLCEYDNYIPFAIAITVHVIICNIYQYKYTDTCYIPLFIF